MPFLLILLLFPVIFHAVGKDVVTLAKVVQKRIGNGADGHFTVSADVFRAAEGEKGGDALGFQKQMGTQRRDDII